MEGDDSMAIDWENYGRERTQARQSSGYHTRSYVDGNTVRKESTVPSKRERVRPRTAPKRYPERQPARIAGISGRRSKKLFTKTANASKYSKKIWNRVCAKGKK